MKLSIKSAVAGAASLALAGAVVVAGAGVASAAPPSPFDPAGNGATRGTISFYDASGNPITSGSGATAPKYAVANAWNGETGTTRASLFGATPVKGQNVLTWPNAQISTATTFPITSGAPANILNKPNAIVSNIITWFDASTGYQVGNPNANSDPAWQNFYQVRMLTSGTGIAANAQIYASATIYIDPANGNWTQVYPPSTVPATDTALAATPAGPQGPGTSVTLQATVKTPNASGTAVGAGDGKVQFSVNGTNVGSPVSVNASGQASQAVASGLTAGSGTPLGCGSNTVQAVFTPTDAGLLAGSTSTSISTYVIRGTGSAGTCPQKASFTALTVNPSSGALPLSVGLTATVYLCPTGTPAANCNAGTSGAVLAQPGDGTVQFSSSSDGNLGTANVGAGGVATVNQNNPTPNVAITFTATFTPSDPQAVVGSNGTGTGQYTGINPCQSVDQAGNPVTGTNNCVDPQNVRVTVPVGTLAITTPYTAASPFNLGNLSVNPANPTQLLASKSFPDAGQTISVLDTRAGSLGWTASVNTTDFTSGANTIDGNGLSLTGVSNVSGTTAAGPWTFVPATNFKGVNKAFASVAAAPGGSSTGTTLMQGTMTLVAPSSTKPGTYNGTVTFTVA